jgi:serine protease DegS
MAATTLSEISTAFQTLVESAQGRVVCVGSGKATPRSGLLLGNGELVTVARAASNGEKVPVHVGEQELAATVTGFDPASGIALLAHPDLVAEPITPGEVPAVGSISVTVACPIPGDHEARLGLIRCAGQATRLAGGRQIDSYFQTDSSRFRGFAGSVVFGPEGQVLGLTMPAHRREEGFVLPAAVMLAIVEQLRQGETLGTGYLGIQATAVDLPREEEGFTSGLLVTGVEPDSPAESAGVTVGNFIVKVGEKETEDIESLFDALVGVHEGAEMPVSLVKPEGGAEVITVKVTLRR